ncbi:GNAT family N-acetyltransferase [Metaclostridioides mangenotii]|uniref:GNAT family N-acetyltransferase n=1 Tax=Metaclostridioides mangenotii TaxID=1540 RepID=UPI0026EDB3BD|nr:GNAT family N-acetyltransferase [Clostridioides mangenotii]
MINVRYAIDKDIDDIKKIWSYCFGDTEKFMDYYFSKRYFKEHNVVVEQDESIISSLQLAPYKINLNGKVYKTSYVVGVSTLPEARGKGFMKSMMNFTLEELYKTGEKVSILMPIDYRIYRRYGYEHCYDQIQYNIDVNDLRSFRTKGNFHKSNKDHIKALIDIAADFQLDFNGNTVRGREYFENLFGEIQSDDGNFYIYENDGYKGYLVYSFNGDTMLVRELFYKDIDSLKSMMGFIYNHNTQCKKVSISAPIGDKLKLLFDNPKDVDTKFIPFMMGRVIDVRKYFESINVNYGFEGSVNVKVVDNQIKENNHVFKINIKDDNVIVDITEENEDLELSINALTQIAFSYLNIDEVLSLYEIDIDKNKKNEVVRFFRSLLSKKNNYINDYI